MNYNSFKIEIKVCGLDSWISSMKSDINMALIQSFPPSSSSHCLLSLAVCFLLPFTDNCCISIKLIYLWSLQFYPRMLSRKKHGPKTKRSLKRKQVFCVWCSNTKKRACVSYQHFWKTRASSPIHWPHTSRQSLPSFCTSLWKTLHLTLALMFSVPHLLFPILIIKIQRTKTGERLEKIFW